jgi:hypothetical protein
VTKGFVSSRAAVPLIACLIALGACSNTEEAPKAPPGAMEGFAAQQSANEASAEADRVDAARMREAERAADARQKSKADAGIARFEKVEEAADAERGAKAQ